MEGVEMNNEIAIKKLTKHYESCPKCGLPELNCICGAIQNTNTEIHFWILSSKREFYRPSNTARLIKLINPHATEVFLWERTNAPVELIKHIHSNAYDVFLLFPAETEELEKRRVDYIKGDKKTAFIIIDGTWKEARKILRKADYLSAIPVVSIAMDGKSSFDLRKGADEGQFCTIEAAIEVLSLNGEADSMASFQSAFDLFLKAYRASVSGHKMKPRCMVIK